jgi:hypothetical protein
VDWLAVALPTVMRWVKVRKVGSCGIAAGEARIRVAMRVALSTGTSHRRRLFTHVDCVRLADNPDKVGQQRRASGTSIVVLIDALASDLQVLFRFRNLQDAGTPGRSAEG